MQRAPGQSRRWAVGFAAFCALPFVAGGVFVLVHASREFTAHGLSQNVVILAVIGIVFTLAGALLPVSSAISARKATRTAVLRARNPNAPWLWREEWSRGAIRGQTFSTPPGAWLFAIIVSLVSLPVGYLISRAFAQGNRLALVLSVTFPLAIGLVVAALYARLRRMRFGVSLCRLDHIPLQPGTSFRGQIETDAKEPPANGFLFRLTCIHERITDVHTGRRGEEILWRDERVSKVASAAFNPPGVRVPFQFEIPPDARATDFRNPNDQILWRLYVSAEMPGVDYSAQFELPVFATAQSAPSARDVEMYRTARRTEAAKAVTSAESGIVIMPLPAGGAEFRIARRSAPGLVAGLVFANIFWFGVVTVLMVRAHLLVLPLILFAFGALLLYALIDVAFGRSTLWVDSRGMKIRRDWLGARTTRFVENAGIESIGAVLRNQSGSTANAVLYYNVEIKLRGGRGVSVARYISSHENADMLAARIWIALGRRDEGG